jgi:hypothetical protein
MPIIIVLTKMFDFRQYAFSKLGIIVNKLPNIYFCHQFKVKFAVKEDKV